MQTCLNLFFFNYFFTININSNIQLELHVSTNQWYIQSIGLNTGCGSIRLHLNAGCMFDHSQENNSNIALCRQKNPRPLQTSTADPNPVLVAHKQMIRTSFRYRHIGHYAPESRGFGKGQQGPLTW